MKPALRKDLLGNLAWFAALALALGLLFGGSLWRLESARAHTAALEAEVQMKLASLGQRPLTAEDSARLESTEAALLGWQAMVASESKRVAALSAAAKAADVTLVSLQSLGQTQAKDGSVACSHRLRGTGDYRQLARFFDGIHEAPGMASIEELEIEHEADGPHERLQASLLVTWYAVAAPRTAEDLAE